MIYDLKKIKRFAVAGAIGIVVLIVVMWLYNHSFLIIKPSGISGSYSAVITDQRTGKSETIRSSSPSIRKLVTRGSYQVSIIADTKNSFAVAQTSPFLSSTTIETAVTSERSRTFVGDNPAPCMALVQETLLSHECGAELSAVNIHTPATAEQPSFLRTGLTNSGNGVEAILGDGTLISLPQTDSEGELYHTASTLTGELKQQNIRSLTSLSADKSYTVQPMGGGLLFSSDDLTDVQYARSLSEPFRQLKLPETTDAELTNRSVLGYDERVALVRSNVAFNDEQDESIEPRSEISIISEATIKTFELEAEVSSAVPCSPARVCVLINKEVVVYEISGSDLDEQYRISGVSAMQPVSDRFLFIMDRGILAFDADKQTGSFDYVYGTYKGCGVQFTNDGYLACVISAQQTISALHITTANAVTVATDRFVAAIAKNKNISQVSAYKNVLYVTPNVGDVNLSETNNDGLFTPAQIEQSTSYVQQAISASGLPANNFVIVNTVNPF